LELSVEGASGDLLTQEIKQIDQGGANRLASPFGQGQVLGRTLEAVSEEGAEEQHAIEGNLELGEAGHGLRTVNLSLRDAEQGFLIAVIALDLPAIDVGLHEGGQIQVRVGADEEGGFTVEKFGALAEAIAEGFDDH
jgi:hypothetical protein